MPIPLSTEQCVIVLLIEAIYYGARLGILYPLAFDWHPYLTLFLLLLNHTRHLSNVKHIQIAPPAPCEQLLPIVVHAEYGLTIGFEVCH